MPETEGSRYVRIVIVLLLLVLLLVALVNGCAIIRTNALRPVAERLGTSPSQEEIANHINRVLQGSIGAKRSEVHRRLDEIGTFTYPERFIRTRDGIVMSESIYWTIGEMPLGGRVQLTWTLVYDTQERLAQYNLASS